MYTPKSLFKAGGSISPGAPIAKDPNVTIIEVYQIVSEPERDDGNVKMEGSWTFKPGYEPVQLYMTPSTQSRHFATDGDEDAVGMNQDYVGNHPGETLEVFEFIQYFTGRNVIILAGSCQSKHLVVYGSKCAPLQLKGEHTADNDGTATVMTFEQAQRTGLTPGIYYGPIPTGNVHQVGDVAEVALSTENGMVYKLPSDAEGTAIAVDSIDLESGDVVTLIGSGGDQPAELATGGTDPTILLINGTTWVAEEGQRIDLEYFNDGADEYLVEKRRY